MTDYGPEAPVQIFQHVSEFNALLKIYIEKKPARVLEIGSYHGGTLYHWLLHSAEDATVVSVDTYTAADNRDKYPDWTPEDVTLIVIEGNSHYVETVEQVREHAPYDFIFIDAGHYYSEVRADWENYMPMATPHGIIALHDILTHVSHPEIEVEKLWREIRADGYPTEQIIASNENAWGGIGVVYL